jgi:hypothetical protein
MLTLMEVESPQAPTGAGPLSYRIAAAVDFGTALKQQLLEQETETERLSTLGAIMETLIPRLELRKEREEAIRGTARGTDPDVPGLPVGRAPRTPVRLRQPPGTRTILPTCSPSSSS